MHMLVIVIDMHISVCNHCCFNMCIGITFNGQLGMQCCIGDTGRDFEYMCFPAWNQHWANRATARYSS